MSDYDDANFKGYSGLAPDRWDIEYMSRYNTGANNRANEESARAERVAYRDAAPSDPFADWSPHVCPAGGGGGGGGGGDVVALLVGAGGVLFLLLLLWKVLLAVVLIGLALLGALHVYDALVMRRGWRHPEDAAHDALVDLSEWAATVPDKARRGVCRSAQLARDGVCMFKGKASTYARQWRQRVAEAAARTRHALVVFDSRPRRLRRTALRPIEDRWAKLLLQSRLIALDSLVTLLRRAYGA